MQCLRASAKGVLLVAHTFASERFLPAAKVYSSNRHVNQRRHEYLHSNSHFARPQDWITCGFWRIFLPSDPRDFGERLTFHLPSLPASLFLQAVAEVVTVVVVSAAVAEVAAVMVATARRSGSPSPSLAAW
jgi:hypothetical protein